MDPIDKHVAKKLSAFENEQEPGLLQGALEIIEKAEQDVPAMDEAARRRQLSRWLLFFATLDRHIDQQWNPEEVPTTGVIPPPSDGVAHFSGVDPSAIADPAARAQYEQALKASKDYADRYRIQQQLRRMDERAMNAFGMLLTTSYIAPRANCDEFTKLLTSAPLTEARKERLRTLIPKPD